MPVLRPAQEEIMDYPGGRMGISAVPGSGKPWTLSLLAADLIYRGVLKEDQEILIVTLVNSAVDNFYQRISGFVKSSGLLPNIGYRVRTLHGLAHDIVRERPALLGLENNFQIIDDREADFLRSDIAQAWLNSHPDVLDEYFDPEVDESRREWLRREQLPKLIKDIATSFIGHAKDRQLHPDQLKTVLQNLPLPLPLAGLLNLATPVMRLGMRLRLRQPRVRVEARVISIGNITAGGTGKTPAVIERARRETRDGHRVAVLTRGYGAQTGGAMAVHAGKGTPELCARLGDEPAPSTDATHPISGRRAVSRQRLLSPPGMPARLLASPAAVAMRTAQ